MTSPPVGAPSRSTVTGSDAVNAHLDAWLAEHGHALVALRRYLHAHPELSGAEHGTATLLAERLGAAGLAPRMLPKGNGVICDIGDPADGPGGGRTVALRADLDALPLPDVKDVPYRSTVDGVCHACGHDAHAAIVTGAGLALAAMGAALPGQVRLLLQPSEEMFPSGSLEVIEAGGIKDVAQIFAVHCDPRLLTGYVGLRTGPLTAAADMLRVRLSGAGGHTARPHLTVDLVGALARIVTEVPALLAGRIDARAGLSLVFGAIHAGIAPNAIPEQGSVSGTVRVLDHAAWDAAPGLIKQLVADVVRPTGATVEVEYVRGVPPVVNDAHAVSVLAAAVTAGLGAGAVADTGQSMGGEDFSWYLEHVPGAMARLGVGRPGEALDLHQGAFDIDDRAIGLGVRLLVHTALQSLAG